MSIEPGGTITFLFSDIEGSTDLVSRLGDAYAGVLGDHRRILRGNAADHRGQEIDAQGDSFFFSFPRARDAVAAAVAAQRELAQHAWPDSVRLMVRMGIHTGEPSVADEGFIGLDVVRAARIAAIGHGGQILISDVTRGLVRSDLPEGVTVRSLGPQRLRGIEEPEAVHELLMEGLSVHHPPRAAPPPGLERREFADRARRAIEAQVLSGLENLELGGPRPTERRAPWTAVVIALMAIIVLSAIAIAIMLLTR